MSIESISPDPETFTSDEREQAIQMALTGVLDIRRLITEHERDLKLERSEHVVDFGIAKHLTDTIHDLEGQLEDMLDFLKEYDPALYEEVKNQ